MLMSTQKDKAYKRKGISNSLVMQRDANGVARLLPPRLSRHSTCSSSVTRLKWNDLSGTLAPAEVAVILLSLRGQSDHSAALTWDNGINGPRLFPLRL